MRCKIVVYLKNGPIEPSAYYRVLQYMHCLNDANLEVRYRILSCEKLTKSMFRGNLSVKNRVAKMLYYIQIFLKGIFFLVFDSIFSPDTVVISRSLFPKVFVFPIPLLYSAFVGKRRLIWDIDDNIFIGGEITEAERKILEINSNKIVVSTEILAQNLSKETRGKCVVLPTTDGTLRISENEYLVKKEIRRKTYENTINLVWIGTNVNLKYVREILPCLDRAAEKIGRDSRKRLRLLVISNERIDDEFQFLQIQNISWEREMVAKYCEEAHIGLMPLEDNEYNRGKAGFKLIQYMLQGIPVLGSAVGYNETILSDEMSSLLIRNREEWAEKIESLAENFAKWEKYSELAYNTANKQFSFDRILDAWKEFLIEDVG